MAEQNLDARTKNIAGQRLNNGNEMEVRQLAQNQLLAIQAEQKQNLAMQRTLASADTQNNSNLAQAAVMAQQASENNNIVQAPINPATQQILSQYGYNQPSVQKYSQRSSQQITKQNITINNYNTSTNTTNNNNQISAGGIGGGPIQGRALAFKQDNGTGKFQVWLNNTFARQNEMAAKRDKEYMKRESALTRSNNKMMEKLEESSKAVFQKMDPRNLNRSFKDQMSGLLKLIGFGILIEKFPKMFTSLVNIEHDFREYFGIGNKDDKKISGFRRDIILALGGKPESEGIKEAFKKLAIEIWDYTSEKMRNSLEAKKKLIDKIPPPGPFSTSDQLRYIGEILKTLFSPVSAAVTNAQEATIKESNNNFDERLGEADKKTGELSNSTSNELNEAIENYNKVHNDINSTSDEKVSATSRKENAISTAVIGSTIGLGKVATDAMIGDITALSTGETLRTRTVDGGAILNYLDIISKALTNSDFNSENGDKEILVTKEFFTSMGRLLNKTIEPTGQPINNIARYVHEVDDPKDPRYKNKVVTTSPYDKRPKYGKNEEYVPAYYLSTETFNKYLEELTTKVKEISPNSDFSIDPNKVENIFALEDYGKSIKHGGLETVYGAADKRRREVESAQQTLDEYNEANIEIENKYSGGRMDQAKDNLVKIAQDKKNYVKAVVSGPLKYLGIDLDDGLINGNIVNKEQYDDDATWKNTEPTKESEGTWRLEDSLKKLNQANEGYDENKNGYCARGVREALEAGGLYPAHGNAWTYNNGKLEKLGFTCYDRESAKPYQKGDILVTSANEWHPNGHIAMWNGEQWVSDFKQHNKDGNIYKEHQPHSYLYRYNFPDIGAGSKDELSYSELSKSPISQYSFSRVSTNNSSFTGLRNQNITKDRNINLENLNKILIELQETNNLLCESIKLSAATADEVAKNTQVLAVKNTGKRLTPNSNEIY